MPYSGHSVDLTSSTPPKAVVSTTLKNTRTIMIAHLTSLAVVITGLLAPFNYSWPDFVHTDYGFPFVWARHTTVTFLGPADKWDVNLIWLALDIAVLMLVSFLLSVALLWIFSRQSHLRMTMPSCGYQKGPDKEFGGPGGIHSIIVAEMSLKS